MKSRLKIDRMYYIIVGAVTLSVTVTSAFYLLQQSHIRQRNKFLEEWHSKNYEEIIDCRRLVQSTSSVPTQTPQPKVFTQRKKGHIHQITANPSFTSVKVTTTDMDTGLEILNEKDVNPYNFLFSYILVPEFDDIVLDRDSENLYAVIKVSLGMSGNQLYLLQTDSYGAYPQVEPLKFFPSDKHGLCGIGLIDYFPQQKQILIQEGCYDGSAGVGTIKLISHSGKETKLNSFVAGTALATNSEKEINKELPVTYLAYLAYVQEQLYFGEMEVEEGNWEKVRIVKIFSVNPLTGISQYVDVDFADSNLIMSWKPHNDPLHSFEISLYDSETQQHYALDVKEGFLRELGVD